MTIFFSKNYIRNNVVNKFQTNKCGSSSEQDEELDQGNEINRLREKLISH